MSPQEFDACYATLGSRDRRFDGQFFVAVTSTGVYCRPSCPAIVPKRRNVRFYATAAAAQAAGFRACLRCHSYAAPGSPLWNQRGDLAARALGLIADGLVDREGVGGLARRLSYSERHLHRQLRAELGAGPLALARAQRAQSARMLIQTSRLSMIDIAHAAGFSSIRQFNDTIRAVYGRTPTQLRAKAPANGRDAGEQGALVVRLDYRPPLDWEAILGFLAARAVPGVEEVAGGLYARTLRLPRGHGIAELSLAGEHIQCRLWLQDLRDLAAAVQRCRRLLDLDADPSIPTAHLSRDPLIRPLLRDAHGLRVPGSVDGSELAFRAVLGQQVSVAAARTTAGNLARALGEPLGSQVTGSPTSSQTPMRLPPQTSPRCRGPWRDGERSRVSPASSPPAGSRSIRAATAMRFARSSPRSRGSANGPSSTSRCERSPTPTPSFRATSA